MRRTSAALLFAAESCTDLPLITRNECDVPYIWLKCENVDVIDPAPVRFAKVTHCRTCEDLDVWSYEAGKDTALQRGWLERASDRRDS